MNSLALLAVAFVLHAPSLPTEAEKATEKLQGEWKLVAMQEKGEEIPADEVKKMNILFTFEGKKLTVRNDDGKLDYYSFTIDPTKSPAHIDLKDLSEHAPPGVCHAICLLADKELKLCLGTRFNPDEADERPTEFATIKGSEGRPPKGKYLFVLQKPKK